MADALTQQDIDSLLTTGDAPQQTARKPVDVIAYNFLRPPRITRDRQGTLEAIYSRFAVLLQTMLSSRLRTATDVMVSSVEQATFSEFQFSLANPCAAFFFELAEGSDEFAAMDLGTDMAFYLVDRLFGGPGESAGIERAITPLERLVVRGIAEKILELFGEAWSEHLPFKPVDPVFEATPESLQIANEQDNVLVGNLEVKSGSFAGWISTCIPLTALEHFLQEKPSRSLQAKTRNADRRSETRAIVESVIRTIRVPVAARFPEFSLKSTDIARLAPGRTIMTGHTLSAQVEMQVCGHPYLKGAVGKAQNFIGLRITEQSKARNRGFSARIPKGKLL